MKRIPKYVLMRNSLSLGTGGRTNGLRAQSRVSQGVQTGTASSHSPVEIRDTGILKIHPPPVSHIVANSDLSGSQSSSPVPSGPRTLKDIYSLEPEVPPTWGHHQDRECEPYSILCPSAHSLFYLHRAQKSHLSPWRGPGQPLIVNILLGYCRKEI